MARKIFVSYKHGDTDVAPIRGVFTPTARDYTDAIIDMFEGDEIYKGEGNEDLSEFKEETIETHLKNRIYDSSLTIVLISPNMKNAQEEELDQWIPWEISYSLKEITRKDRKSHTNAMLAVVLPDRNSSYEYYLVKDSCPYCRCQILYTNKLFKILGKNMFNIKIPEFNNNCMHHAPNSVYRGYSSYIYSVSWEDFQNNKGTYIDIAEGIRENIESYNITKTVEG